MTPELALIPATGLPLPGEGQEERGVFISTVHDAVNQQDACSARAKKDRSRGGEKSQACITEGYSAAVVLD